MRALLTLFMVFLIALPALASTSKLVVQDYSLSYKLSSGFDARIQPYSSLELNGTFKIWYLLNEPAVNCTAAWTNPGVLQVVQQDGTRILSEPGEEEMWNLVLMAQFANPDSKARSLTNGGGAHLSVFCDAGVVAQNGQDGFNVAGSPNWDKFICSTPNKVDTSYSYSVTREEKDLCLSVGGEWLPAPAAKAVAQGGISISEVIVHGVELSASGTIRRAEKMRWRKQSYDHKVDRARSLISLLRRNATGEGGERTLREIDNMRVLTLAMSDSNTKQPGSEDLQLLDQAITRINSRLGTKAPQDEWAAKDRQLVAGQLERMNGIDLELRRREAELTRYRETLLDRSLDSPEVPEPEPAPVIDFSWSPVLTVERLGQ